MSDFFAPSYWYGAGPNFSGLANAQAQQAQNNNYYNNINSTLAQANAMAQQATGNLTQDPAKYAAIGAAYGRAVGPAAAPGTYSPGSGLSSFSGVPLSGGSGGRSPARVDISSSPFDVPNAGAVPYLGTGGGDPFGGGGFQRGFSGDAVPHLWGGGNPFGDGGFGGNIFDQAHNPFANGAGSPGSFADRFQGGQYYQPGTPSQYTTEPYTDAQGRTYAPNIPKGFQTPFSVDNPGGALPASRQSPFPIMGGGEEPSGDTLTAGDRAIGFRNPFEAGAQAVPFMMGGGQAFPGGGIGGYRSGNQRDQLAAIMSGSGGNEGAAAIGRGFSQAGGGGGGGYGSGSPPPMSPFGQMPNSSVWGRAMQMPSAMGGASPKPPSSENTGGWGTSSMAPTGRAGASNMGGAFTQPSANAYVGKNFGEMQTPEFSQGNIVMGDRLRGQGPPSLSPFVSPGASGFGRR